jgi:hypothetical protein
MAAKPVRELDNLIPRKGSPNVIKIREPFGYQKAIAMGTEDAVS